MKGKEKLTIMVSSTVYGVEELLDRIYYLLDGYGYNVWISYKGTVPVFSNRSAIENCIAAVQNCDLFLGLINPNYGTLNEDERISITHQELKTAIELKKPRWLLVHDHVVFARSFLKDLGYNNQESRNTLSSRENGTPDILRVIDMYEEAILLKKPPRERKGDWVQEYYYDKDATLFAKTQFFRYQEVEAFIKENFSDSNRVSNAIQDKGDSS